MLRNTTALTSTPIWNGTASFSHRSVATAESGLTSSNVYVSVSNGSAACGFTLTRSASSLDRKSTRLNSSHGYISYAVFCLKKKNNTKRQHIIPVHLLHQARPQHARVSEAPRHAQRRPGQEQIQDHPVAVNTDRQHAQLAIL